MAVFFLIPIGLNTSGNTDPLYILFLLIPWLLGIFISLLFSMISSDPGKKRYLFIGGQFAFVVGVIAFALLHKGEEPFNATENIESNRNFIIHGRTDTATEYQTKAFKKLESAFANPGDFQLNTYIDSPKDTVINGDTLDVHYLYFKYERSDRKNYFSKLVVLKDSAYIEIFNGDVKDMPPTMAFSETEEKQLDSALQQMPESQRKEVRKALKSVGK